MNSFADFEDDFSIIVKAHSLTIKRSKKEIKLILLFHITYETIEIKIYENSSNKLLGREILTYSDIFQIFNNYFICLNENMKKIFESINNSIKLKKYEIYFNEVAKTINFEVFILKENNIDAKNIFITSCDDKEKWKLISLKIKELNSMINRQNEKTAVAPFLDYIKYENNFHLLYIQLSVEEEIEILTIKAKLINKNNMINNLNEIKEEVYNGFYSKEEINKLSKYYEHISDINEISDDIKINLVNKNFKIDSINDDKIKITVTLLSSVNFFKLTFELIKGLEIKNKYIQIIKELKLKNEFLINNDLLQNNNYFIPEQNNQNKNNIDVPKNSNSDNDIPNEKQEEKKLIAKKRKRKPFSKKVIKNEKMNNSDNSEVSKKNKKDLNGIEHNLNIRANNKDNSKIKNSIRKGKGDKKKVKKK